MIGFIDKLMGHKEIEVFKVKTYPVLVDIDGLRETAVNIEQAIKKTFLDAAKLVMVGKGTSGASLMTAVSMISDIDACLLSAKHEDNHRGRTTLFLGDYNHLIVVDDRIEEGNTMKTISTILKDQGDYHLGVKMVCVLEAHKNREQLIQLFPNCKYFCY